MNEPNNLVLILTSVNAVLLAFVGFFLKSLYTRFTSLENEVKGSLISSAVEAQRIGQIEKDLSELKQVVMSSLFPKNK